MSAALCLPAVSAADAAHAWPSEYEQSRPVRPAAVPKPAKEPAQPLISLAFYRKYTASMLRRYLYASLQVGRAPSILHDPVGRGWVSSRRVRTFEDAVIFVLDIETCLNKLNTVERALLSRVILQDFTQAEAAQLLGMSVRAVSYKLQYALDHLTELLLEAKLLIIPDL